jgi:hypothetical protein
VKVTDPNHFRFRGHVYEWGLDQLNQGPVRNGQFYLGQVNAEELCGVKKWRIPTRHELLGIVDYGRERWAVDPIYFPNTWSRAYFATGFEQGFVDFASGRSGDASSPGFEAAVRAVSVWATQ